MSNALAKIEKEITSTEVTNRLTLALGLDPEDEKSKNEAFKYASSVIAEIAKTAGDSKKDLTVCTPDSICQTMIDAAQFRLAIDGKQHAHIVKYGNKATLQIGFRGYIAKICEHYQDADFTAEAIYKDDVLSVKDEGGYQTYTLDKGNPFNDQWGDLEGVLVRMSYTKGGKQFQKITLVSKGELTKIRGCAKTAFIWNQWPIEKAKAAAIKRSCKLQFTDVMGLQDMVSYDNTEHFDLDKPDAAPVRKSIVDNINESLTEPEDDPEDEVLEGEIVEEVDNTPDLIKAGNKAAKKGVEDYKKWIATLSDNDKSKVKDKHDGWSATAKDVDKDEEENLPF